MSGQCWVFRVHKLHEFDFLIIFHPPSLRFAFLSLFTPEWTGCASAIGFDWTLIHNRVCHRRNGTEKTDEKNPFERTIEHDQQSVKKRSVLATLLRSNTVCMYLYVPLKLIALLFLFLPPEKPGQIHLSFKFYRSRTGSSGDDRKTEQKINIHTLVVVGRRHRFTYTWQSLFNGSHEREEEEKSEQKTSQ